MFRLCLAIALVAVWQVSDALESVTCSTYDITNCGGCDIPDVDCYSCGAHYVMNDDFSGCTACPSNCHLCEWSSSGTTTICTVCEEGYILKKDGTCSSCGSYCDVCHWSDNSQTTVACDECSTNEGITLGSLSLACLTCGSNCMTCSEKDKGATTCSACFKRYFLSGTTCTACPSHCVTCSASSTASKGSCSACDAGYVVNTADPTLACLLCPTGCSSCNGEVQTAGKSKCTACTDGYYLDDTAGTCNACPDGCATCSSASVCDTCLDYYSLEGTSCNACEDKCITCSFEDAGETCSKCDAGWGVQGEVKSCSMCPSNCKVCSDSSTCTTCKSNYYLNDKNGCTACSSHCTACTDTTDRTICDVGACEDGYYRDATSKKCVKCGTKCIECTDGASACTTCADDGGYYFKNSNGNCDACSDSKCTACAAAAATCTACVAGYYADTTCKSCPSNCLQCDTDHTKCDTDKCASGYYLLASGACTACTATKNCATCPANVCNLCKTGYFLDGTTCRALGACATASYDSSTSKTSCSTCPADDPDNGKYYILNTDDSTCHLCPAHCTECSYNDDFSELQCLTTCEDGYGILDNLCQACPNYCTSCSVPDGETALVCDADKCVDGYWDNDLNCGQCPPNCLECNNVDGSMICTVCKAAYAVTSAGMCQACPANCKVCQVQGTKTICNSGQCNTGYGRNTDGSACVACSSLAFANCDECSDANGAGVAVCTSCFAGYIIDFWQTVCLSTSSLTNCAVAGYNGQFARPVECSAGSCQSPFSWIEYGPEKGLCGISCAICGDIDSNDFRPADECQSSSANYTQMLQSDGCWVARKVVNGVAMYARGGTDNYNCTKDYSNEVVTSDGTSLICCSSGDNCNSNLQLDGVAGASSVTISIALLIATIFAMISNLF